MLCVCVYVCQSEHERPVLLACVSQTCPENDLILDYQLCLRAAAQTGYERFDFITSWGMQRGCVFRRYPNGKYQYKLNNDDNGGTGDSYDWSPVCTGHGPPSLPPPPLEPASPSVPPPQPPSPPSIPVRFYVGESGSLCAESDVLSERSRCVEAVAELGLGTLSSAGQNTDDFPRGCIAWMEGSQVYGSYWNEPVHWSRGKGSSTHRPLCFGPHPGPPPSPPPSSPPVFYVLGLAQERLCPPPPRTARRAAERIYARA